MFRQIVQLNLPAMVGGRLDGLLAPMHPNARMDPGGYMVVKGSEKVVIPQQHLHINRCFVFPPKGAPMCSRPSAGRATAPSCGPRPRVWCP